MASKKAASKVARDHVVIAVRAHGLSRHINCHGPFTKAQAYAFANWQSRFEGDECMVEEMEPACEHQAWVFEGMGVENA